MSHRAEPLFPLVIDQRKVDLPTWPRSQEWWDRFMPGWAAATVRPDDLVELDVTDRLANGSRSPMDPPAQRRQRKALVRWFARLPHGVGALIPPDVAAWAADLAETDYPRNGAPTLDPH